MSTENQMLPIERLRERIAYNPESGEIRWVTEAPIASFPDARCAHSWHAQWAGKLLPIDKTRGYVKLPLTFNGKRHYILGHRAAWALMTGAWPTAYIDHIDRDRSNNKWSNLREADGLINSWNRGITSNNSSGAVGVRWCNRDDRWKAEICTDWRRKHLGSFMTMDEAVQARRAAEIAQRGEFAVRAA